MLSIVNVAYESLLAMLPQREWVLQTFALNRVGSIPMVSMRKCDPEQHWLHPHCSQ